MTKYTVTVLATLNHEIEAKSTEEAGGLAQYAANGDTRKVLSVVESTKYNESTNKRTFNQ